MVTRPMVGKMQLVVELLVLALLPRVAFAEAQAASALRGTAKQLSQVLVFDAGSSGTRVHIFNLMLGKHVPEIDLSVRDKQTKKVKPGLSSFAQREDLVGVKENIEQLLDFANQFVLAESRSSTPALLKATAGLRAVEPQEKAQRVLQRVREVFSRSGYLFRDEWADIIKGKEEGGLAWIAANYLQGVFSDPHTAMTLGVIEMGGGSTQVAFEVQEEVPSDVDNFRFKTLSGKVYKLYAHSYLGFGQDHAQAKMQQLLTADETKDPCYPVGYVRPSREDGSKLIEGAGNAQDCQSLIRSRLMTLDAAPGRYSKELGVHGNFVGTENFVHPRVGLNLPFAGDVTAMKDAAEKACSADCGTLGCEERSVAATSAANPLKPNHCFGLAYQVVLLEALKSPEMEIKKQINGGDVDWAVGAALMHVIDSENSAKVQKTDFGITLLLWIMAFAIVALGAGRFYFGGVSMKRALQQVLGSSGNVLPTSIGARASPAE